MKKQNLNTKQSNEYAEEMKINAYTPEGFKALISAMEAYHHTLHDQSKPDYVQTRRERSVSEPIKITLGKTKIKDIHPYERTRMASYEHLIRPSMASMSTQEESYDIDTADNTVENSDHESSAGSVFTIEI